MFIHVFMFGTEINELIRNWLEENIFKIYETFKVISKNHLKTQPL